MFDNNINVNANNPIDNVPNKPKINTEQVLPFDVIDPTKVTRTPKQDTGNQIGHNILNYNPDSVFEKFIESLKSSPVLSEGARKLLLNKQFINHNIYSDPVLKSLFESFVKTIEMNDEEILNFLKFQQGTYTKFHGEFFDNLRALLKTDPDNNDFKYVLKNFLRSYDCFISVEETNKSISAALNNIERNLPEVLRKTFNEMTDKLISDNPKGADLNLNLLKNEIIPFIGKYISKMNDFGPVRNYVSVLIHNTIRLETASINNFYDDLEILLEFIRYNFDVNEEYIDAMNKSLINKYEGASNVKNDSIDSFLKLLYTGSKESKNLANRGVMDDIKESLLFSQNVHIPLTHIFLPLNYNGMFMFSEIWIGKKYEELPDKKKRTEYCPSYKVFITFDIQNLGYFETTLVLKESGLSLDIYVPAGLSEYTGKIKDDLNAILSKDKLNVTNMTVQESVRKRRFNEVFSNLTERKNGVDVTI